jgi:hypothetical protein
MTRAESRRIVVLSGDKGSSWELFPAHSALGSGLPPFLMTLEQVMRCQALSQ